jgi:triacylglycerol lipase
MKKMKNEYLFFKDIINITYILTAFFIISLNVISCKTMIDSMTGKNIGSNNNSRKIMLPKYPIILVHGIVAHDRGGIINFWGRIPGILHENGIKVFLGNTDSWGGYESNAELLKATIDKVLEETNSEKVNIIAHSKGGIDSRYFIWKYDYGDKVASLTTISTPHHGSEIADLIHSQIPANSNIVRESLDVFGRLYGDRNPDLLSVDQQLTTENMREFNEKISMDNRVHYQSFYTTMSNSFDDLMFFYSYLYVESISGPNDGIVSEHSARWGNNIRKIGDGISHAQILDYREQEISGISIPGIYMNIINELCIMGF